MYLNLKAYTYAKIKFYSVTVEIQILLSENCLRRSATFSMNTGINVRLVIKGLQFEH